MKVGLVAVACVLTLGACSGQQVQDAAQFTAGAALMTVLAVAEADQNSVRTDASAYAGNPIYQHFAPPCELCLRQREQQRQQALLDAAEAYATAPAAGGAEYSATGVFDKQLDV